MASPSGTFRRVRIGVLLGLLLFVIGWSASIAWRRHARGHWERPLEVGIVLLAPDGGVDPAAWREGAARLSERLAEEMRRWRGPGPDPFAFTVVGPVAWTGPLPVSPPKDSPGDRLWHAVDVWRKVRAVERAASGSAGGFDVRVFYLAASSHGGAVGYAEGSGALNGEVALLRGTADGDLTVPLQAIGHEILHTVGATDKYDAAGHARAPEGLADPERTPPYPQDHAEWMVGEVPLGPGKGRVAATLDEMRVGPATAREIGWAPR